MIDEILERRDFVQRSLNEAQQECSSCPHENDLGKEECSGCGTNTRIANLENELRIIDEVMEGF